MFDRVVFFFASTSFHRASIEKYFVIFSIRAMRLLKCYLGDI